MIADSAGGVRVFSLSGWDGDSFTWMGVSDRTLKEKFVYTKLEAATMRVDWVTEKPLMTKLTDLKLRAWHKHRPAAL